MTEPNHYNPKYSREEDDLWQESMWQTGSIKPPKNRGGLIAVMLILIIFLCGIITVLGILNVKLFRELNIQEKNDLSISFSVMETEATLPVQIAETTTYSPKRAGKTGIFRNFVHFVHPVCDGSVTVRIV